VIRPTSPNCNATKKTEVGNSSGGFCDSEGVFCLAEWDMQRRCNGGAVPLPGTC